MEGGERNHKKYATKRGPRWGVFTFDIIMPSNYFCLSIMEKAFVIVKCDGKQKKIVLNRKIKKIQNWKGGMNVCKVGFVKMSIGVLFSFYEFKPSFAIEPSHQVWICIWVSKVVLSLGEYLNYSNLNSLSIRVVAR
jgi:hypothetical protein